MTGNLLVGHTTEGTSLAGAVRTMEANRSQSNTVFDPKFNTEHVFSESSSADRSLRNLTGGVETNNRPGVWQIEIVGYSHLMRRYSDWWYERLERYLRRKCADWDIPYEFPYEFKDVDDAYGTRSSTRLTSEQWLAATGIVGHQHVPENTHWDPGPIDVSRLNQQTPTTKEAGMASIKDIQHFANEHGSGDQLAVDGDFGPKSRQNVLDTLHLLKNQRDALAVANARIAELELGSAPAELTAEQKRHMDIGKSMSFIAGLLTEAGA